MFIFYTYLIEQSSECVIVMFNLSRLIFFIFMILRVTVFICFASELYVYLHRFIVKFVCTYELSLNKFIVINQTLDMITNFMKFLVLVGFVRNRYFYPNYVSVIFLFHFFFCFLPIHNCYLQKTTYVSNSTFIVFQIFLIIRISSCPQ